MELLAAGVDDLESSSERNDIDHVDVIKLRGFLKDVGNTILTNDEATSLKHLGMRIWNACVKLSEAHVYDITNVKFRHLACDALAMALNYFTPATEEDLLILYWREIHNYELAGTCFSTAMEYVERIQKESKSPSDVELTKRNSVIFSIYSMRAEMAVDLQEKEVTYNLVSRAKELLPYLPEEVYYLAMKCYNLGIVNYNNKNVPEAIKWLEEAYQIYAKDSNKDPKKQARTLRLLANAYMITGNYDKASSCTVLATEEFEHPASTYLQIKLDFITGRRDEAAELVPKLVNMKECTFDIAFAAVQLAIENRAVKSTKSTLLQIEARWYSDPKDFGKAIALHVSFLMSPDGADVDELASLVDSLNATTLVSEAAKSIHISIWRWFLRALRFLAADDSANRTKCSRIIARCHLELNQPLEALEYARQGALGCKDLSQAQFLLFKVYLSLNDAKMASEYLMNLIACSDFNIGFLEVCSQEAHMHKLNGVAATALELILLQREGDHSRVGLILRTLIRMSCTQGQALDVPRLCEALRLGVEKIRQLGPEIMFSSPKDELAWIIGLAWNTGLELARKNQNEFAYQLFRDAAEFAFYQGQEGMPTNTLGLVFSTACLLQSAFKADDGKNTINLVLTFIDKCRAAIKRWSSIDAERAGKVAEIILMMEFAAKARLQEPGLSALVQQAVSMNLPASKFETMANICYQGECKNPTVCVEALRACLRLSMQPPVKYDQCARIFRRLIDLTEQRESFVYFEEISGILQGLEFGTWPAIELQWLIIKAWNIGVYFYRLLNYTAAEKWMSQALFLLKYYPEKALYEAPMYSGYTEVLSQVKPPQAELVPIE